MSFHMWTYTRALSLAQDIITHHLGSPIYGRTFFPLYTREGTCITIIIKSLKGKTCSRDECYNYVTMHASSAALPGAASRENPCISNLNVSKKLLTYNQNFAMHSSPRQLNQVAEFGTSVHCVFMVLLFCFHAYPKFYFKLLILRESIDLYHSVLFFRYNWTSWKITKDKVG